MTLTIPRGAALSALLTCAGLRVLGAQITTAQYDNARTGAAIHETALTPRNVNPASFGRLGAINVDGDVYAQVLAVPRVAVPGKAARPAIFVATEHNAVYAFDGTALGRLLWHVDLSGAGTPISNRDLRCPFIRPEVGITATPVIDTATGTMYVLTRTAERGGYVQRLHALDIATGGERRGSPVEIRATVPGRGDGSSAGRVAFDPRSENPRAALLLVHGAVILSWASSCDIGPFHGWIMAYDARSLAQVGVFNATPNGSEGGVWQGDAGLAADAGGAIYAATSNGTFDAATGGADYGDSMLRLTLATNGFSVTDYFTPSNQKALETQDADFGSGGPLLVPDQPGVHPHVLFVGAKSGGVFLLDRDKLGHFDANDRGAVLTMRSPGMVMGAAAYWNDRVYALWSDDVIKAYRMANGQLSAVPESRGSHVFSDPGATPTISANGTNDGIVWVVETRTWNGRDKPAVLHAYDAANVATELYTSEMNESRDRAGTALRFAMVTVASGRVYVGVKGAVDVYGPLK